MHSSPPPPFLQEAFPGRFKGLHFINQPWYISIPLSILLPFFKQKLRERVWVWGVAPITSMPHPLFLFAPPTPRCTSTEGTTPASQSTLTSHTYHQTLEGRGHRPTVIIYVPLWDYNQISPPPHHPIVSGMQQQFILYVGMISFMCAVVNGNVLEWGKCYAQVDPSPRQLTLSPRQLALSPRH